MRILLLLVVACGRTTKPGPPPPEPAHEPVTVVYSEEAQGEIVRLLGVSAGGERAYLIRERADPPAWALETIDLARGTRAAVWRATDENAAGRAGTDGLIEFFPVDGTLAADLARFASITTETGSWATRAHEINGQATDDGTLYRSSDSILLAPLDQAAPRVLATGSGAGERVSPDGEHALWLEGELLDETIVVSGLGEGSTSYRSAEHAWFGATYWSVDGTSVLAERRSADPPHRACALRFAADLSTSTELACVDGVASGLAQDPTGATVALLVTGDRGDAIHWLDARTGAERAVVNVGTSLSPTPEDVLLDERGRWITISSDWTELVVCDLASGAIVRTKAGGEPTVGVAADYFEGVRATRFVGDDVIVLRRRGDTVEVVRVDIAELLGQ